MADTQELLVNLRFTETGNLVATKANLAQTETAAAKATAAFGSLNASVLNLAKGFLGITAAFKVVDFLGGAIKAAQEDEASIVRLTAALKANVPAWDGQTDAVDRAIVAGAKLGFTDDEIRGSLARLVAATHDLGEANRILSVAQDLARFKGVDLATATDALVRIEAGRYRGLADLGIVLEKGTTQTQALAAVEKVAAGQAEAFGKSSAGAAAEAGVAFHEAEEAIGRGLLPVITSLSHVVKDDLAPALTFVGENMDKILPVVELLALAIGAKLAIGLAKSTIAFVENTALLVINKIAAAGAATSAEVLAAAEVTVAGAATGAVAPLAAVAAGETAVGAAGATAAAGGVAALLTGLKAIVGAAAASAPVFQLGGEITHQFAAETAEADFKTRSYAEALQRLKDAVGFGSLTQAEADTILARHVQTIAEATTGLGVMTQTEDESARAARLAAAAEDAHAESIGLATTASLRYAFALTGSTTGTEADAAAKAYDALVAQDLADKTDYLTDAFGRLFKPLKQAPEIFGAVADAQTGRGGELEAYTQLLYDQQVAYDADTLAALRLANAQQRVTWIKPASARNAQSGDISQPNTGGMSSADYYLLQLDQAAQDKRDREARDAKAEADRIANAKVGAADYASVLKDKLGTALSAAKDLATSLFDKLHERHLQAIADTEKLAEKQHDAATQAISDSLKASLARDAAPVTEAEKAQSAIEISRQNRDLHASLTAAQQTGDPEQIRRAQEALQSFQAAQNIAYLKEQQARQDLAATKDAADKQKVADDLLATAKTEQAAAIKAETNRNKKQVDDFDKALSSLKERDKGKAPGQVAKDITALENRFGITTDAQGKHHIEDPLVTAIKSVKIPVPRLEFHATLISPPIYIGARQVVAALASHQSPAATPGVRTGILTPARG